MNNGAKVDHVNFLAKLGLKFDPKIRIGGKKGGVLFERLARKAAGAKTPTGDVIIEGNRNSGLMSVAGSMRARGAGEDAIRSHLRLVNLERVQPPLDDEEVQLIANSVMRYPPSPWSSDQARSLNDTGNAVRFADALHQHLRYVPEHDRWIIWSNDRWAYDDARKVVEMAKYVARAIYGEAQSCGDPDLGKAIAKHAGKSLDSARIKAMMDLAKSDPRFVVHPRDLDRNPELLGVANGVLHLPTGVLHPNRPEDLITRHAPVPFDPAAKCPVFMNFLRTITANDKSLLAYIQRAMGYAISGLTDEQVLFFLHGTGANGKSTLLKVLEELLGSELCRQLPYDSLIAKKHGRSATNDLARLDRVRVVQTSEVEDGSRLAESLVKQLTGGESIAARFHYAEFFEFTPQFKLFIAGNHKPIIRGDDLGIWRRIQLMPFDVTIPDKQRDPQLGAKLRAELPGILTWAVIGFAMWSKARLAPPRRISDAVDEYQKEMDVIGEWIRDDCVEGPGQRIAAADAYRNYKYWAENAGLQAMSGPIFGRKLLARFVRTNTNKGRMYEGLGLKTTG